MSWLESEAHDAMKPAQAGQRGGKRQVSSTRVREPGSLATVNRADEARSCILVIPKPSLCRGISTAKPRPSSHTHGRSSSSAKLNSMSTALACARRSAFVSLGARPRRCPLRGQDAAPPSRLPDPQADSAQSR
jgi:hypothetical protein